MDESIVIRVMENYDLSGVMEIERVVFPFPWSRYSFLTELDNPNAYYLVAVCHGKVAAYGGIWLISTEAHVTTIAVAPSLHRDGIGSALLQTLLTYVWEQGGIMVALEVRSSNKIAQTFYLHHGFTNMGIIQSYYVNDGEDAIRMTCFKRAQQEGLFVLIHCAHNQTATSILLHHPKRGLVEMVKTTMESGSIFCEERGAMSINRMISAISFKLTELEAIAVHVEPQSQTERLEAVLFAKGLAYGLNKPCIILSGAIDSVPQAAYEKLLHGDFAQLNQLD